jgi:hypothetical protein
MVHTVLFRTLLIREQLPCSHVLVGVIAKLWCHNVIVFRDNSAIYLPI